MHSPKRDFFLLATTLIVTTFFCKAKDNHFYDLSSFNDEQKRSLMETALAVMEVGENLNLAGEYEEVTPRDAASDEDTQQRNLRIKKAHGKYRNIHNYYSHPKKFNKYKTKNSINIRHKYHHYSDMSASSDSDASRNDPFQDYNYGRGNCPNAGSEGVPCAPSDLSEICDKYDRRNGSFRDCFEACKPSFCCTHDAKNNELAEPCQNDENCAQYTYCYIVWWKLHDTIGPAIYLLIEQNDDFYDMAQEEIEGDVTGDPFWNQAILHHFDDIADIIDYEVEVNGEFNAKNVFDNPDYWEDGRPGN